MKIGWKKKTISKKVFVIFFWMLWVSFLFFWITRLSSDVFAEKDLLMKAFEPTIKREMTIDLWETKTTVGHSLTRNQTSMKVNLKKGLEVEKKPPLLVRIAKILLRFTIVLAVTMIIYNAIIYGIKVAWGDDYKSKESLKQLGLIFWGIVLALLSVALISLMQSVWWTLLNWVF